MNYTVSIQISSKKYVLIEKSPITNLFHTSFFVAKDDLGEGQFIFTDEDTKRIAEIKFQLEEAAYVPFYQVLAIGDWVIAQNHEGQIFNAKPLTISAISTDKQFLQINDLGQSYLSAEQVILTNYYQYNPKHFITRLNVSLKITDNESLYFEIKDSKDKKICFGIF